MSYVYIMVLHIHLTKDMHMQSVCWMFKVECIDNNLIKVCYCCSNKYLWKA